MTVPVTLPLPTLERATGRVALAVAPRGGRHVISDLAQAGCGRLLFPRIPGEGPLEAVVVNTSGGLTGGDRFEASLRIERGGKAIATTQACEKIYRSGGDDAVVETRLSIGEAASLAWLPQETILFDRARLVRRLTVDMAASASLLLAEAVLLGRVASGERLQAGLFRDSWRIRRGGRLVFAEELKLSGDLEGVLAKRPTLSGHAAFATVLLAAPDGPQRMEAARALLTDRAIEGGISTFDGLCVARLVAQDGARLRSALVPLLAALGGTVPRVWSL
jgi:urease accessory protein